MSEEEYSNWFLYITKYETPDVNEIQMAVLTNIAVSFAGSKKKTTYKDFLVRGNSEKSSNKPISASAIRDVFKSFVP